MFARNYGSIVLAQFSPPHSLTGESGYQAVAACHAIYVNVPYDRAAVFCATVVSRSIEINKTARCAYARRSDIHEQIPICRNVGERVLRLIARVLPNDHG